MTMMDRERVTVIYCVPLTLPMPGDAGFQGQVPEETSPHLLLGAQDQQFGEEQDQLPRWSTGTSSGNCWETETCMAQACHMP